MPKSKHRRNGKNRPNSSRPAPGSSPRKHPYHSQPCPEEMLIEEFGEEGADWLTEEYRRPLTRADLELEKAIRFGSFTMDHPEKGATEYTLTQLSATLWMAIRVMLEIGRQEGVLTASELEGVNEISDAEVDHEEHGPDIIRNHHHAGDLFLNHRGMWDFGEGQ